MEARRHDPLTRHALYALAIVGAFGCKQRQTDGAGALAAAASGGVRAEGALFSREPEDKAGAIPHVDCDKAIPRSLIDKYLPDATPQWGEPFDNGEGSVVTSCRLIDPGLKGGTLVRYQCGGAFTSQAHGELPCVIEIDELGEGQVADRTAFLADLQAALTPSAVR